MATALPEMGRGWPNAMLINRTACRPSMAPALKPTAPRAITRFTLMTVPALVVPVKSGRCHGEVRSDSIGKANRHGSLLAAKGDPGGVITVSPGSGIRRDAAPEIRSVPGHHSTGVGDEDDPAGDGEEGRLSGSGSPCGVEEDARQEGDGKDAVDEMEHLPRSAAQGEHAQAGQALHAGEAGQEQVGGAEATADRPGAEERHRAPDAEDEREDDEGVGQPGVEEGEDVQHEADCKEPAGAAGE